MVLIVFQSIALIVFVGCNVAAVYFAYRSHRRILNLIALLEDHEDIKSIRARMAEPSGPPMDFENLKELVTEKPRKKPKNAEANALANDLEREKRERSF